jgi:hypothetical protein
MNALHDRTQNLQAQSVAADLAARVAGIFEDYPILCGFSVQRRSTLTKERAIAPLQGELCLADVSVSTWPGFQATLEFYDEIVCTLLELMDEQPEAFDFLSGRTFARTLH